MAVELVSKEELLEQWRDRWEDFLDDIEAAKDARDVELELRDKITIGNAERRIAGGHEGREILELLQNSRDAIRRGDTESGKVHIGVYDEGVMVANTGSRFDFFDPEVEKAVTMIGETGKGDGDTQSIGHKGVGLKSILATGDSFEIYTRPEEQGDEILGVKLSRSYVLGALLSRLGVDVSLDGLAEDIQDASLRDLILEDEPGERVGLDEDVRGALSKLPLFNFPVPVDVEGTEDEIVQRAKRLLREGTRQGEQFRTVVFVRYADDDWRDLLQQSDIPLPDEGSQSLEDRPTRIWNYLSHSQTNDGLRKETLVQLGGIDALQLERHTGRGLLASEEWNITRSGDTSPINEELCHETVDVSISGDDTPVTEVFDQFQFRGDTDHGVSLLVGKDTTTGELKQYPREYPLYLYYPIQNTATTSFPFCLHGRFQVETNRKDLSNNSIRKNQSVLQEGIDLIEAVSEETAQGENKGSYGDAFPWLLLPPVPEDVPDDPTTQSELLRWFCRQLYDRLQASQNIAIAEGAEPATATETLLHWKERALKSYLSLDGVGRLPPAELNGRRPVPATQILTTYQEFPEGWSRRLRELVLSDTESAEYTRAVVRDWAAVLSNRLTEFDEPAIRAKSTDGRNLLYGLVDLLSECTDGDDEIEALLSDLSETLEGVYLLPCRIPGDDAATDDLQLVPIERRRSPQGQRTRDVQSRSVIWDIESTSRTTKTPDPPSRATNFTVYFMDRQIQEDEGAHKLFSLAGRLWGIRAYEGIPSFVRSVLDTFAFGPRDVLEPIDFAFLTLLIQDIGQESDDLKTTEGSYLPVQYLNSAVKQSDGDQRRNLERRLQLRDCAVQLNQGEDPFEIRPTRLGDGWQAHLLPSDSDEEEETPTLNSLEYETAVWPEPSSDSWAEVRKYRPESISESEIARTLSLLGGSAFPNIRVVWMYGEPHPDMRQSPAWNPRAWPEQEFGDVPTPIQHLLDSLDTVDGAYLDWITAPGFHPQDTAGHSSKCSVKLDGVLDETNLAAWVWYDDISVLEQQGSDIIQLLERHGERLRSSLLQTGWSCTNRHVRRDWESTVPTLFNWQLRQLDAWSTILSVHEDVSDRWPDENQTLEFAVQSGSSQGAQASRLFPSIDAEGSESPSESVLNVLGVKSIDSLNSTQAARRLQKLQEVLSTESLGSSPVTLDIPSGRENDWNQAYKATEAADAATL